MPLSKEIWKENGERMRRELRGEGRNSGRGRMAIIFCPTLTRAKIKKRKKRDSGRPKFAAT